MMKKRFEAAFDDKKASYRYQEDSQLASGLEILARSSSACRREECNKDGELVLAEAHSKLDRVLSFLQQEIGYILLDDASPGSGGGLCLNSRSLKGIAGAMPCEGALSSNEVKRVPAKDDASVAENDEKKQNVRESTESGSSGEGLAVHEEIRYSSETAKYAHYPDDLVLVWRFITLLGEVDPVAQEKVNCVQVYKTVLQAVRQMHLCQYGYSDIVVTLAYASVYFKSVYKTIGHKMSAYEVAFVCVLLIYLAHSFVLDETCPLHSWQKQIFRKYCSLKVLDAALFRLFRMREYQLRITPEEEKHALSVLLCSSSEFNVILSLAGGKNKIRKGAEAPLGPAKDDDFN